MLHAVASVVVKDRWGHFKLVVLVDGIVWARRSVADTVKNLRSHECAIEEGSSARVGHVCMCCGL